MAPTNRIDGTAGGTAGVEAFPSPGSAS